MKNFSIMQYELFSKLLDNHKFPMSPAGYFLIIQFEIILRYHDEIALLLCHPSYKTTVGNEYETGILCPPFIAHTITSEELYYDTTRDIVKLYQDFEANFDLIRYIKMFLYGMGLTNYKIEPVGEMIEFKSSNREPGKFKCYKVIRYSVVSNNSRDLINIIDPLVLSKHIFLPMPIENPQRYLKKHDRPEHGICFSYKGMSLSSNLCRIIEEPSEVSKLTQRAIDVDPRMFYKHYFGFVIRLAIANFGKLSQSILATDAFLVDSKELESQYELSLHSFFVQLAIDNSLGHRVLLGDGFIGAIPVGLLRVEEVIENVSGICAKTEQYVENINAKLGRQEVGFRCAVLYGEYYYGRLNLHENAPYITGYNLIKVSRLEEGLKQALKSGEAKSSVILDFETYSNYKDSFEQYFSVEGDAIEVKSKETTIQAVVCKLKNAS